MATSSSTDSVQTVIDLLSGDSFPNKDPDSVEKRWKTDYQAKLDRSGLYIYVHSYDLGTQDQLSTEGSVKDEEEHVRVEVWSPVEADAVTGAQDVKAVLEDYWSDRTRNTEFHRIRPETTDDRRHESLPNRGTQYVFAVDVRLRTENPIGT